MLDTFEAEHPEVRVVRLRPALVFQRSAASELRRFFIGPFVPAALFRPGRIPIVPNVERLRIQCVHASDLGHAFSLAALSDVKGAFNVAADPVIDPLLLAHLLGGKAVRFPPAALRGAVSAAFAMHLTPVSPGWVDLALGVPLMKTTRIHRELGFTPKINAKNALLELFEGLHDSAGGKTAPLRPQSHPG